MGIVRVWLTALMLISGAMAFVCFEPGMILRRAGVDSISTKNPVELAGSTMLASATVLAGTIAGGAAGIGSILAALRCLMLSRRARRKERFSVASRKFAAVFFAAGGWYLTGFDLFVFRGRR